MVIDHIMLPRLCTSEPPECVRAEEHKVAVRLRLLNLTQLFSQAPLPDTAGFLYLGKGLLTGQILEG
jgi:hypothetical protein